MTNLYEVKVQGVILVQGETHADVKECVRSNSLLCQASEIKYLDIEKITLIREIEEHEHDASE